MIGSELEQRFIPPATRPKKVLIAGGGPGGMQCAITAAMRGHEVMLCELTDSLGGALKAERGISFKEDLYKLIAVKARQMQKVGVDVRLNTGVTPELARIIAPDAIIVAAGSRAYIPRIPGIEKAIMSDDLPDARDRLGQKIVVIGGGLVGCETGIHLAREGCDVTIVEMRSELCPDANRRHRPLLLAELSKSVTCITDARAVSITDEGLICDTKDGVVLIPANSVICAAGRKPNRSVIVELSDCAPYVEAVGDCVTPTNVAQAVFRGHFAALDI